MGDRVVRVASIRRYVEEGRSLVRYGWHGCACAAIGCGVMIYLGEPWLASLLGFCAGAFFGGNLSTLGIVSGWSKHLPEEGP